MGEVRSEAVVFLHHVFTNNAGCWISSANFVQWHSEG